VVVHPINRFAAYFNHCFYKQGIQILYIKTICASASLSSILALSGCVTATPIITPSGQQGFSLNCSAMNDIGQCYKKAGELCGGNGYEIYDKNNKPQKFFSAANQTMVIRCKAPISSAS